MSYDNIKVGRIEDFKNGEMKSVSVGENKEVLIVNINDELFALGAHCTHYSGSLQEGILNGGTIICPLHHACFNAKTGELKEPPAADNLPQFEVIIENDNVLVRVPDEFPFSKAPEMTERDEDIDENYVIIGGGAAGYAAAQAMREAEYKGRITIITRENRTPYDRPNLSKDYLQGSAQEEWMPLRPDDFYSKYNIEFMFDMKVNMINIKEKKILFEKGEDLSFTKLLIATGGTPREIKVPGANLKNIFYLRSFSDSDGIIDAAKNSKEAVIIGSSFIGMESASSLIERGVRVTVISPDNVPFERTLGKEIGELLRKQHEESGVGFKLKRNVKGFEGNENVESVFLDNGEKVKADFVVAGIGVKPATDFIDGLVKSPDGGIKVDDTFWAAEDIYAAGDAAVFPFWMTGEDIRIEHWRTALQQGRTAGFSMAGKNTKYESIPFFWTYQAGLTIRYVGYAKNWDDIIYQGDVSSKEFIAFYVKGNKVIAAAGIGKDKEIAAVEALMKAGKMPSTKELKDKKPDLPALVKNT
jgi:NADPH-dependent 2,4-dienoyl-CoA reductase/sulfur reductase-like enzyme/nitrite reductase/ring-hydroxylating ferredoxin subunit